ncbi:MAG TPA: iron uptake porin [Coleofasciculaceae cyanobacterium]
MAQSLNKATSSVAETDNTSVQTTAIAASGITATPATNSLSNLEATSSSIQTTDETRVEDLKTPDYLQAQALPAEADANEPLLIDPLSLEPVEPSLEEDPMGQVTNVSQLRDVSPGDWAYEALRSLVERYGCIAGYPDGTFRGNRAMSRYEFAAGLNACLQQVERLIAGIDSGVSREDFESLQRLVQEFQTELTTLGTRVDSLEGRVGVLEDRQFSTTTKLFGQAIIGFQGRTGDDYVLSGNRLPDEDTNINVINNVQLSLFTQFSPRTLLLTSFQAGEGSTTSAATRDPLGNYVGLGYEVDNDNDLELTDLNVRHLFGSNLAFIVGPEGVNPVNVFRGINRIESAGSGPLSRFAQRNPIINIGRAGAGVGFDWQVGTRLSLQGVYSASRGEDPDFGGIFGGDEGSTAAGAQLVFSPTDTIDLSFQYINAYSPDGFLGTGVGDDRVALQTVKVNGNSAFLRGPINTNAFGANVEWRVMPKLTAGGWVGFTDSNFQSGSGDVQTFNWMAFLNFPDLFGEGNLGGLYVGQPPRITDSDITDDNGQGRNVPGFFSQSDITRINPSDEGGQPDTTIHLEAFYRLRVNDNISITPGVIVLLNPLHNNDNDTITIGAIRTTFTF